MKARRFTWFRQACRRAGRFAERLPGLVRRHGKRGALPIDADMPPPRRACTARTPPAAHQTRAYRQSGQALPEMLLLTTLLLSLWMAVDYLARSRMAAMEAAQLSRRWAFVDAQGGDLPSGDDVQSIQRLTALPFQVAETGVSRQGRQLASDWLALPASWSVVQARAQVAGASIVRHTALAGGSGAVADAVATQLRLGQSALAWQNVASVSLARARQADLALRPLDRPWAGRKLDPDWLMPWAGLPAASRADR